MSWWSLLGLLPAAIFLAFAIGLLRAGPFRERRPLLIMATTLAAMTLFTGLRFFMSTPEAGYAMWFASVFPFAVLMYGITSLAGTFDSRVGRLFSIRWIRLAMPLAQAVISLVGLFVPALAGDGVRRGEHLPVWFLSGAGLGFGAIAILMMVCVAVLGLAVLGARSRHGLRARQRKIWLLAVGGYVVPTLVYVAYLPLRAVMSGEIGADRVAEIVNFLGMSVPFLLLLAGFSYGALTARLFDIDLKLKFTIKQSTLAAIFVAVFVGVQTFVSEFFTSTAGLIGGAVATAALVFALAPLQRFAARVSDKAMPEVSDTPEYRAERARDIYRAAVESAKLDGEVTEKERDLLATLADSLHLSAGAARDIERHS